MKPSPFVARSLMAVASLIGLFVSAYLLYAYVSGAPIACGSGGGCALVRLSKWAWTFGVPRPLFGLLFYAGMFGLLVTRVATNWQARWLYRVTMLGAVLGCLESIFLFFVQWLDIRAFCLWCLASTLAAMIIALMAWFDLYESERTVPPQQELKVYFLMLLFFTPIALIGFGWLLGRS